LVPGCPGATWSPAAHGSFLLTGSSDSAGFGEAAIGEADFWIAGATIERPLRLDTSPFARLPVRKSKQCHDLPDHAVMNMTEQQLKSALQFTYALNN
jgi:hypothetical protein